MIIGFFLALVLFAPLAFFITRGVLNFSHSSERRILGVLALFLGQLVTLSLVSFAMLGAASALGMTAAVGVDVATSSANVTEPGIVSAIGGFLLLLYSVVGVFTGPACAFLTAKVVAIVGLITALVKVEESVEKTWLPVVAAGAALVSMWPFTAYLTLGL